LCCKNSLAIFNQIFTPLALNSANEIYKQIPTKTVELWELHDLVPAAKSVKKICDLFELPLEYFGKYYAIYFKKPEELFIEWKNRHDYSYYDCVRILVYIF